MTLLNFLFPFLKKTLFVVFLVSFPLFSHGEEAKLTRNDKKLLEAVEEGDLKKVQSLVEKGANVNAKHQTHGRTVLTIATHKGHKEMVSYLITNPALDVNKRGDYDINVEKDIFKLGMNPLLMASQNGDLEIVKILLSHPSIDVNAQAGVGEGHSALHFAAREGHPKVVKLLLENGADVNVTEGFGYTALTFAASEDIEKLLKQYGAEKERIPGTGAIENRLLKQLNEGKKSD